MLQESLQETVTERKMKMVAEDPSCYIGKWVCSMYGCRGMFIFWKIIPPSLWKCFLEFYLMKDKTKFSRKEVVQKLKMTILQQKVRHGWKYTLNCMF